MFDLFDILRGAQGGAAIDNVARHFGLAPAQVERAMQALMPAFAMGLQGSAREPDAFRRTLGLMSSGQYAPFFDNPALAFTPQAMAQGNAALGELFGSKDVSRQVAREAAAFAGIGPEILKQMLPVLVSMLLGGLFRSGQNQSPRGGQSRDAGGGIFEQILDALRGGAGQPGEAPERRRPEPRPPRERDDDFERPRRREMDRPAPRRPDPYGRGPERETFPESRPSDEAAGGGWGDVLADILRGQFPSPGEEPDSAGDGDRDRNLDREPGRGRGSPPGRGPAPGSFEDAMSRRIDPDRGAPEEPRRERWPRSDREAAPPQGDAFDTWGRMFKTGQDVQEQYAASLQNIFDTVWGRKPGG